MAQVAETPPRQPSASRPKAPASAIARQRLQRRLNARRSPWRAAAVVVALVVLPVLAVGLLFALATRSATAAGLSLGLLDETLGQLQAERQLPADSMVYDRAQGLIADVHPAGETRRPVSIDRVSPLLVKATVDVEDHNFWHEGIVDPARIVSAAWNDIRGGGPLQGASTITQQLAKVKYLNDAPTLGRKVRELFVARHIESSMSKEQILQEYLNDIPYGHGATGVAAAARTYFDSDSSKLNLAQAAMLAGLPDAPSTLDPLVHPEAAKQRQKLVLQAMVQAGDITTDQADQAAGEELKFADGNADNVNLQPAFVNRVKDELQTRLKLDVATAGLQVTTTLDPKLQRVAQDSVAKQVGALKGNAVTDGALVSADPAHGDVVAYVGSAGPDVPGGQIDMAAVPRQPGSTFKLFTYATAIGQRKVTSLTPVLDSPFSLPKGGGSNGLGAYVVKDYSGHYHGIVPVEWALGNSLNVPAVRIEMYAGIPNVVATARAMGVTTLNESPQSYTPSLTLGAYPVPLWEMAQAATVFASGGKLQPLHFVQSAKDGGGRELLPQSAEPPRQVLDPTTAFVMNQILSDDSNRVLEFGARSALTLPDHRVAAKTGTTNDFKDNLTVGWTPYLVTATWVGNADNHAMQGTTGVTGAAPIWHEVMAQALAGTSDDWQAPPGGAHQMSYEGHRGWVLDGTNPTWIPELTGGQRAPASTRPSAAASAPPSASTSASASAPASPNPSAAPSAAPTSPSASPSLAPSSPPAPSSSPPGPPPPKR